jgi:hypothetical protein
LQIYVKKTFRDRVWRWPIHAPLVHVPGRRPASRWACYRPLAFTIHSRSRCRMLHYGVGGRTRRQPAVHRTHLHPKWTYPLWPRHLGISRADRPHWTGAPRRPSKPPVTTLRSWLECYGHRPHLQEKAAELWAYQTTIIHTAHTYEGVNWVAYDRLCRREMLAVKNLNWSVPNQRPSRGKPRGTRSAPIASQRTTRQQAVLTTQTHPSLGGSREPRTSSSGRPHLGSQAQCHRSHRKSAETLTATASPDVGTCTYAPTAPAHMRSSTARIGNHRRAEGLWNIAAPPPSPAPAAATPTRQGPTADRSSSNGKQRIRQAAAGPRTSS